jgi:glycerophosphoryl diester phosphodiesterase
MWEKLQHPLVIAHRGASELAPENTLEAFQIAVELNASAIELDVMLCADQHPVVIHDNTVDRTTNGTGKVSRLTIKELKQLDAGNHFGSKHKNCRIPELHEVLMQFGRSIPLNLELKNSNSPFDKLPEITYREVQRCNCSENILYSSFNPIALMRIKQLDPNAKTGLINTRSVISRKTRLAIGSFLDNFSLHPHWQDITLKLINRLSSQGKKVIPYTVNDPRKARTLIELGVHGIITNKPQILQHTQVRLP